MISSIENVHVRLMTQDDVEEASSIEAKTFSMPWKAEDFLEMVKAPYAYYFVAEMSQLVTPLSLLSGKKQEMSADSISQIVGIIGLRDIAGEGEITNVAVDADFRRLGIGRKLIEAVLDKSKELNISNITLEVRVSNAPAIRLYESYGFKCEGIRPKFYEHPIEDAAIYWRRTGEERDKGLVKDA